jgi:hypothetical protein
MNAEAKKRYKDIDFPFTCPVTKREFNSSKGLSVYLTKTLKVDHSEYYDQYINHRESSCFFCGCKGTFISASKGYRNLCEDTTCVEKSFKSHSVEGIMYRKFVSREEAEIIFEKENQKQLEERLKTQNKLRKEDPLWDKKRSRNCKEFWIEKGYSEEESILKSKEVMDEIHQKTFDKFKSNPEKYASKYPTKIEYWLERGYSDEEAKVKLKERQTTFSKEVSIEKYGEKEGLRVWLKRQEKWMNNMNSKTDEEKIEINRKKLIGCQYSTISQKLFWDIFNIIGNNRTKFGELEGEFYLINENKKWFAYDYVDMIRRKCIEFNGDFWHCNPDDFNENDIHRVKNKTAKEIWEIDRNKIDLIKSKGYDVLVIWDSEYRKDPESTLQKCLNFLNY